MANTYTPIYIHVVFAVQNRMSLIRPEHDDELQKYITGIVIHREQKLIAINDMPDHVHLLVGLKPTMALSDLVGAVKSGSSGFINDQRWTGGKFSWQEGFGGFSYAHSLIGYGVPIYRESAATSSQEDVHGGVQAASRSLQDPARRAIYLSADCRRIDGRGWFR